MNYSRSCDRWAELLKEANRLEPGECRRHALVAIANNHRCVECFCCACVTIYQERERTGIFWVRRRAAEQKSCQG